MATVEVSGVANRNLPSYTLQMPRRRAGTLINLEARILEATFVGREVHGYQIAQLVDGDRPLVGRGTIYKALARLEGMGFMESRWEDAELAFAASRPRRRLYRITAAGEAALSNPHPSTPTLPTRRPAPAS